MKLPFGYKPTDFTFGRILADKAERHGDKTFLNFLPDGRCYSFREMHRLSNRVANGLLDQGVRKGDHVALLMGNAPEMVMTYFALGKIGAVAVPINTAAKGAYLEYYLSHSDSVAIILDYEFLDNFLSVKERKRVQRVIVLGESSLPQDQTACLTDYKELYDGGEHTPSVEVSFRDLAAIMYTSGTTGPSKGIMFTQINTLFWGMSVIGPHKLSSDDIYHVAMPLFHVAALCGGVTKMLALGGGVTLVHRLSASNFMSECRTGGATITTLIGVANFLLDQPASPMDRDHSLRFIQVAPMPTRADEFERRFDVKLRQSYGLSDFALAFVQDLDDWPADKRFSIGRSVPGVTARLVDEDDHEVPTGEVGEIALRKDDLPFAHSTGYYKMPEVTVAAWRNLWFHTGDLGYRDADGYYFHAGRKHDSLRRRGENISAFEVEKIVGQHPSIAEIAVFGVKFGREAEDEVAAAIVVNDGAAVREEEVFAFCKANLPYFTVPRFIQFRNSLPRTATHKVSKPDLVAGFGQRPGDFWDAEKVGLIQHGRPRTVGVAGQLKSESTT